MSEEKLGGTAGIGKIDPALETAEATKEVTLDQVRQPLAVELEESGAETSISSWNLQPIQGVMGSLVNYYRPTRIVLSATAEEELPHEPQYESENPQYGAMRLGDAADRLVTVVVDEAEGKSPRIFVDRNNDEDLTNDGTGEWSQTTGSSMRLSSVVIDVEYMDKSIPYTFEFYRFKDRLQECVLCYRNAGRTGHIDSDGESYSIAVLDENGDGRFDDLDNGTLFIDLNRDGKLVGRSDSAEYHKLNEPFNIHGKVWEVASVSPDGTILNLRASNASVAMKRYLDPGFPAPAFAGEDLSDNMIELDKVAADAKYVLLDFWASWCGPCRTEYPYLRRLHARYKDHGLRIIGVNLDSDREKAVAAARDNQLEYPHLFDGGGWQNAVAVLYRVRAIPQTYLLDQDLNIVAKNLRGVRLESQLAELLGPGDEEAAAALQTAPLAEAPVPVPPGGQFGQEKMSDEVAAEVAKLFASIDVQQLRETDLSDNKIDGSNNARNQLAPGTILAARTMHGRLAKILIEEYGYTLVVSWVTYNQNGDVFSEGRRTRIRGTFTFDLDLGKEAAGDADLWWEQVDRTERYLVPRNGALLGMLFKPPREERPVTSTSTRDPEAAFPDELAIYLGLGEVGGFGKIVQVNGTGRVLASVNLAGTPYGLAFHENRLVAALPGANKVVTVNEAAAVMTVLDGVNLPNPISVAVNPRSSDILVADNQTDNLMLIENGEAGGLKVLHHVPSPPQRLQNMSLAITSDGYILFGTAPPNGVFRLQADGDIKLENPVLPDYGDVAASPDSKLWAATQPKYVQLFYGTDRIVTIDVMAPRQLYRGGVVGLGPERNLVAAFIAATGVEIAQADIAAKTFRTLFHWQGERLVCLAVGTKLPWPHR